MTLLMPCLAVIWTGRTELRKPQDKRQVGRDSNPGTCRIANQYAVTFGPKAVTLHNCEDLRAYKCKIFVRLVIGCVR
jgi:hypothetical protein